MRYTIVEGNTPIAQFNVGDTVTISLKDLSDNSTVGLNSASCTHVDDGVFKWNSSNITTSPGVFTEYLWIMTNGFYSQKGKIVLGGFPDTVNKLAFLNAAVWIDTIHGSAGTGFPLGTHTNPVSNFTNALTIAAANGLEKFMISGSISVGAGESIAGYVFEAGNDHPTIALNGSSTVNTEFRGHIKLSGAFNGHVHCYSCHLSPSTLLEGFFDSCLFDEGNYSFANTLTRFINSRSSAQQGQSVTLQTSGANVDLAVWGWTGKMELEDKDGTAIFDIESLTGEVEIASSCTSGVINVRGISEVTDNSAGGCNVQDKTITNILNIIKQIEVGRWKITGNQMIMYDSNGSTPLYTFNLLDGIGAATEVNPKERVPV